MRQASLTIGLVIVLLAGCKGYQTKVARDQSFEIRTKRFADEGQRVIVFESKKTSGSWKTTDGNGKSKDDVIDDESVIEYIETVLEKGERTPRKYARYYTKAKQTRDGKPVSRSYERKSVLFEWLDGTCMLTGKTDLGNDGGALVIDANARPTHVGVESLVPSKPIKAGDSWPVGTEYLGGFLGSLRIADGSKNQGQAKLVRTLEKNGTRVAEIEINLETLVKAIDAVEFASPAPYVVSGTWETGVDGSSTISELKLKVHLKGTGSYKGKLAVSAVNLELEQAIDSRRSGESPAD